jgi:hypothetical protein
MFLENWVWLRHRSCIPPIDDTDWFDLSTIRDTLLIERPAALTDILTYKDIAVKQGRNYLDEDFVIVGDSLDLGNLRLLV